MSSIFSQIINRKLPANIVYENDECIAFMDIMPVQKGHVLVVPKLEIDNIFDLPMPTYNSLFVFARKVSIAMKKVLECKRIGISVIGFEVPHAHIHLVPINKADDINFNNKVLTSKEEIEIISKKILKELNS